MTAYRIVDQYIDLDDVPSGSYAPVDINQILNDYLNLSSSLPTTYANISASYLLTQHNSYLPHYRVLVTGSGIIFNDDSLSKTLSISVDDNYIKSFIQWNEKPSGSINNSNTLFSLNYTPYPTSSLMLFRNGQLQEQNEDYILSGSFITTFDILRNGEKLLATYQR